MVNITLYVCTCVCVYVYMYTHTHTHIYMYVCVRPNLRSPAADSRHLWGDIWYNITLYVCTCVCVYVYMYKHTHTRISICMYVFGPTSEFPLQTATTCWGRHGIIKHCMHTCMRTYTCTHTRIYIYECICSAQPPISRCRQPPPVRGYGKYNIVCVHMCMCICRYTCTHTRISICMYVFGSTPDLPLQTATTCEGIW